METVYSHNTVEINAFLPTILLDDRRIRIRISDLWIQIRKVQKHMDPTDPDIGSGSATLVLLLSKSLYLSLNAYFF